MILYPTETLYALGVIATDPQALHDLYTLKGRDKSKAASWLVRNIADLERYAQLSPTARIIAERFLPGSVTLVLPAQNNISSEFTAADGTIGFRISSDTKAQELIADHFNTHDAPLTCTSANISGAPTFSTVGEILQQFGSHARMIDTVIDDGPRKGLATTIVKVVNETVTILREGEILESQIRSVLQTR